MGLFDKIKDNAKNISIRAIEDAENEAYTVSPVPDYAPEIQPEIEAEFIESPSEPAKEPEIEQVAEDPKPEAKPEKKAKETPKQKTPKAELEPEAAEESKDEGEQITVSTKPAQPKDSKTPKNSEKAKPESKPKETPKVIPLTGFSSTKEPAVKPSSTSSGMLQDIKPQKTEPAKQAIYARERAAMTALATQRRMNGAVPLFVTAHLNFKTRVYIDRIEYSGSFGKNVLPIEQVAWVKLRAGGTGIIVETTEGKRVVMVVKPKDRLEFAEAVMRVQALQPKREKFRDTQTVRLDQLEKFGEGIDEIEKLAKLFERGIITQEEFDAKKKQILGI